MEIRDIRFFCLTAEMEHVTKAAEKLGVAQPFLTKIIGQLEKEIGVSLFDNIGRKIKLNQYGEVFYGHAKKILIEMDNLRDDMDSMIERESRKVTVLTNTETLFPDLVIEYQKLHPELIFSMSYAPRDEMIEALRTGAADFAVCSPPLVGEGAKGIETDIVFQEHACALLPPGHPMLSRKCVSFEDMADTGLIAMMPGSAMRANLDPYLESIGLKPNIVCETNDYNLIIKYVMSGMGYAVIPRSLFFSIPAIRDYCVGSAYDDTIGQIGISRCSLQNDANASSDFLPFVKEYVERNIQQYFTEFGR